MPHSTMMQSMDISPYFSFETLKWNVGSAVTWMLPVGTCKIPPTENKINAVREKKNVVHPDTPQNGVNGGIHIKHFDQSGINHHIE